MAFNTNKKDKVIKPKLGSDVYIKYCLSGSISFSKVKVIAKGKDLFVHENSFNEDYRDDYRKPIYYEDYKEIWFKSLKEIKEQYSIIKICENYWEMKRKKSKLL